MTVTKRLTLVKDFSIDFLKQWVIVEPARKNLMILFKQDRTGSSI